ncbi:hypothetical protein H5410_046727 [Solanum commersonii]|uniref:Reverse transcriptase domain-containing protein n=1 Tax=Solanum commersonii TaxID=4109 RepID=A0A9J5XF36_SOLCO|nr:hypothetical protein H5410_046727 [Solanum commersonii]
MGTTKSILPGVNIHAMHKGPTISHAQGVETIKEDICDAIMDIFQLGKIYRPINRTMIRLIPKNAAQNNIKDYRPVACCSILYKIITKIIATMFEKVMPTIFVKHNLDLILWSYVKQLLEGLCFPTRFIQCILECVQTVHYSFIVNGEPMEPFDVVKGVT